MKYVAMGYYKPADTDDIPEIMGVFGDLGIAVNTLNETYSDIQWQETPDEEIALKSGYMLLAGLQVIRTFVISIYYAPYNTLNWDDDIENTAKG